MKPYFYRLTLIIFLSLTSLFLFSFFAPKAFAADVGIWVDTPSVPILPSPGDNLSVDVTAYNFLNVRQTAIVEVNVAPGQYITDPDTQTYTVSLPAFGSDTKTLTFGVTSNVCQTGSVPFVATATIYVGARNWGTDSDNRTLSDGIGATLNVNANVSASIVLSRNDGRDTRSTSGTSANFRRLNCNYSYTLTTSAVGYTTNVRTINSGAGSDPKVCNGQETTTTVTLVVPSPSPSPSSSPSPSPSSSASPSPSPSGGLSHSCNPTTLSANWNVGAGNGCNIYIQAGTCAHQISTNCNSSWSGTQLPDNGNAACPRGLWNDWSGTLNSGNTNLGSTTISCGGGGGSGCYQFRCYQTGTDDICADNTRDNRSPSDCTHQWCVDNDPHNGFYCDDRSACTPTASNTCNPPPPPAATCAPNKVTMTITPNPVDVGNQITFSVSGTDNEGSTYTGDTWTPANGLTSLNCGCTTVTQNGNNCGIWGSRNCIAAAATSYTWTHYWSHDINNRTQPQCSKTATYTINNPIRPWIQVTGDVHSNTGIYASGGP